MINYLKKAIQGNGVSPSELCLNAFNAQFENAVNIDWFNKGDCFEAIFYLDHLEHLALFDLTGVLLEYSVNLPSDLLPENIRVVAMQKGEIMNAVLKNRADLIQYEVIARDLALDRFLLLVTENGILIEEKRTY